MSWEGGEGSHLGDKALGLTNPFLSKLNDISGLELPMRRLAVVPVGWCQVLAPCGHPTSGSSFLPHRAAVQSSKVLWLMESDIFKIFLSKVLHSRNVTVVWIEASETT